MTEPTTTATVPSWENPPQVRRGGTTGDLVVQVIPGSRPYIWIGHEDGRYFGSVREALNVIDD